MIVWDVVPGMTHLVLLKSRYLSIYLGFPCGSAGKESTCNVGDLRSIPGLGRYPGEGKGYSLQHSGLECWWVFQICWHIECSTYTASSFRIWNSSTGMPSPPLALFVEMLSKANLASHSRMSASRWVITPLWLSWLWRSVHSDLGSVVGRKHAWFRGGAWLEGRQWASI